MLKQERASWEAHYYFSFLEPKHVIKTSALVSLFYMRRARNATS